MGEAGCVRRSLEVLDLRSLNEGNRPTRRRSSRSRSTCQDHSVRQGQSSIRRNEQVSALIGYLKRLEGVKIGPVEASLKVRELERLYKLEEINALLPAIAEVLARQPALCG